MVKVSPSILSADFSFLGEEIKKIEKAADMIHFDVMDGCFVPNISIGIPVLKSVRRITEMPLDVHLMVENPDKYIDVFCREGADILAVHYEACIHLNRSINRIKENGVKAFVALNPHTPVELLEDIIQYIDGVLVMSVNPGFGGQKFITNTYDRIERLVKMKNRKNDQLEISVDGGVNEKNAGMLVKCGVDILVAGSSVFGTENPGEAVRKLKMFER